MKNAKKTQNSQKNSQNLKQDSQPNLAQKNSKNSRFSKQNSQNLSNKNSQIPKAKKPTQTPKNPRLLSHKKAIKIQKDELFKNAPKKRFEFDESVASVFDDMINRSVPLYRQNSQLICALIAAFADKNASICDLGCSTASLLLELSRQGDFRLTGVDNSPAMLDIARHKAAAFGAKIDFLQGDLSEIVLKKHDIFIANYTLQFIRPMLRQSLVNRLFERLNVGGFFILSEKILFDDSIFGAKIIDLYADFKASQGYTRLEIAKKRESLENVLVPYSEKENVKMLETAGFSRIESFFKWANFESFIAFK